MPGKRKRHTRVFNAYMALANGSSESFDSAMDIDGKAGSIGTQSLEALQGKDFRKVMDVVDKLRRGGLSGEIHLPQLVVSGDQSSGKSSVLEAITEIPFPRKENLCTRYATEIILRRAATDSIITSIIPDKNRPAHEKKNLEAFKDSITNFSELPPLMDKATELMGLGDGSGGIPQAFSRDVLRIEIAGPGRPHLTLVDLPGLIHSENKMQSKEDVELIKALVDEYISNKRTIIMAVVSAKNDYANQIILKKCRDVDPKGQRTIGIITKPDFLEPGSDNEQSWIDLAENKDIFFELGWHILKNRSEKEAAKSFAERNAAEKLFFSQGRYKNLPSHILGIDSLRKRLSQMLYKHLKTELPALRKELNDRHREVCNDLKQLGEKRSTPSEQRRFLMAISTTYQDIVKAAVNGQYEQDFFGDLDPDAMVDDENNMRRLRAVVQYLNLQFASTLRQYGHKTVVAEANGEPAAVSDSATTGEPELDEGYASFHEMQEVVDRKDMVARVRKILVRSRGRELPGTFNPLLISQLFWEQSENWKAIADYHIEQVAAVCYNFVLAAVDFVADADVSNRLRSIKLETALEKRLGQAKEELQRIVGDTKHHPITYDPA
jgi:GTPase SAR1 family protein